MKHIIAYKLFESSNKSDLFPKVEDIEELFYELTDDDIIKKCKFTDSGYLIYPQHPILHTSNREIRSALTDAMYDGPNWENQRHELIYDETFGSIFLDPKNMTSKNIKSFEEEISFEQVKDSMEMALRNKLPYKPSLQLFFENIENGKIPAVSYMTFNCGLFKLEDLQKVIDCLVRIYEATGLRPFKEFWTEDYVEGGQDSLITMVGLNAIFTKTDDITYKNLVEAHSNNKISKEITSRFL